MYEALIMDMLDVALENNIEGFLKNKNIKDIKSVEGTIISDLKQLHIYDQLTNGTFTEAEEQKLFEVINQRFKENFKGVSGMDKIFDKVFGSIEYTGNVL